MENRRGRGTCRGSLKEVNKKNRDTTETGGESRNVPVCSAPSQSPSALPRLSPVLACPISVPVCSAPSQSRASLPHLSPRLLCPVSVPC
ncbi:sterol O-acyltransferase 1 [Tachysurus ichikawai]